MADADSARAETFFLGDDLPKVNPWQDDRLGYRPFCELLSKVVLSLRVPNGYVIGLHGEWGSGKSTALNFVRAFIDKHNQECRDQDRITLVDFQPWIVSGHGDLVAAFFKVITESLGAQPNWLIRQFHRLMRGLRLGGDSLIEAVATVAVTVDPSGGVASKTVGTLAKKSLGRTVEKFLAEPSLQAAYEELRKRLTGSGKRFLVTVDDLDRLQGNEIRSIMQMVKTVGRLPNVVYLLAYDRVIVWNALDGSFDRIGPRFAEKIVQQEIELPRPSKYALLSLLDEQISFLTEQIPDSLRWHYILQDGVHRWIRHPRDLLRLANAVKFSWPALRGEIDPADLLAMEGLRLFDGEAFDWIRWNRDFLFSEGAFVLSRGDADPVEVQRLKSKLPDETREPIINLLKVLFPQRIKAFEGEKAMSQESFAATATRRGVGYAPGYDAFFGLHPSPSAIPKATVDRIIDNLSDERELRELILPYVEKRDRNGQTAVGQVLEEVRYRFNAPDRPLPTQEFLNVIFAFGDKVLSSDWPSDILALSPRAQLSFLIADLLEGWGQEQAGKHLLTSFKNSNSVGFCADVFVDRARELGKIPSESSRVPRVTEADLQALGKELLAKIEVSAAEGTLEMAPHYWDIVRAWSYLGSGAEAKAWLSNGISKSPKFLAKVCLGLVSYSSSRQGRNYTLRSRPSDLYDIKIIREAAARHGESEELALDERKLVAAVAKGIDQIFETDKEAAASSGLEPPDAPVARP